MRQKFMIAFLISVLLVLTACAGSPTPTPTQPAPANTDVPAETEEAATEEVAATNVATEETDTVDATEKAVAEATEEADEEAAGGTRGTGDAATEEAETEDADTSATEEAADDVSVTDEADAATTEEASEDDATATEEAEVASTEADETAEADATEEANIDATAETEPGNGSDLAIPTSWTCPEGFEGQTLSIYNWATFIGDNTVPVFEELCGVNVEYTVYDSDEALIARIQQGNPGFDVAFPTDFVVSILIRQELLEPIDLNNVPNFANIDETVTNQVFDPNNQYSVPYVLGTTGIAYSVEAFPDGLNTWEDFFNAEGRIAWLESPRTMIGLALIQLGYDPNTTDQAQIDEARDFLIEHGGNVVTVAADDGDALLVQGEIDAVIEYGGDVFQQIVECECDDFAFSNPTDGVPRDITSVVILKDAPNKALAEVFIDFLSDPAVAAHNTNQLGYATPNRIAMEEGLIDAAVAESTALNVSPEAAPNAWFVADIGDDDILYTQAWDEVKVNLGR